MTALSAVAGAMALRPASAAGQFKMGLLVPGSVAEEGWNRIAYNALKQVEAQLAVDLFRPIVSLIQLGGAHWSLLDLKACSQPRAFGWFVWRRR